ncbi:MAG: tail fiber domain-containing protein [Armatimonadetes bacterium]|nr:tail fiber domain-containing protein [Armatimonadota bacterium]
MKSPIFQLLRSGLVSTLLFAPLSAPAQTFFGAGGATNTATSTPNVGLGFGTLTVNTGTLNTAIGSYALFANTTGGSNTANGYTSLYSNTTGKQNTATGYASLYSNTTGSLNTAFGAYALFANTIGVFNNANGHEALYNNTAGSYNNAMGYEALYFNTTGGYNNAVGYQSLYNNTTGNYNTANGYIALFANTTGKYNVATGAYALQANTTGNQNTAQGSISLYSNTTGSYNSANGHEALYSNTTGIANSANGYQSLYFNTTGSNNTANGYQSLYSITTGAENTAHGNNALYSATTGKGNIALGFQSGYNITTGSNNITIGNLGAATDNGTIRIGTVGVQTSTLIAGINGVTSSAGVAVYINANGQLGTITSSRRFKSDIKTMGSVSDKLLQLRPVTFRYKSTDENGRHPLQYGLIAEEVAKVFPDLVQYDKQGRPFTVYYHLLTPMLLNELQKEHAKSEVRNTNIATLTAVDKVQASGIAALRASLQSHATDLASMKQMQAEQQKLLVRLATHILTSKTKAPIEPVHFVQHEPFRKDRLSQKNAPTPQKSRGIIVILTHVTQSI